MKKIIIFTFLLALLSSAFFLLPTKTLAEETYGLDATANNIPAFSSQTGNNFNKDFLQTKAGQIIGVVLSFIGALFLILMIYAGILWMTATGNEQSIAKAKTLMINSIIGMIIVFAAYALTNFIGNQILQ